MRVTILIAALVLFFAGVALSYLDKTGGAVATYGAGVFCLIFVYLAQFKRFKGFGLEAELQEKIHEADEALRKLRSITVPMAHMLFTMVSKMGRWDSSIPRRQRHEIMSSMESELRENGVAKEDLETAKADWHRYNIIDLYRPVARSIAAVLDEEIKRRENAHRAFKQPISGADHAAYSEAVEMWRQASKSREDLFSLLKLEDQSVLPQEFEQFVASCPAIPDAERTSLLSKVQEQLQDAHHYVRFREFRRLEHWFASEEE